MNNSAANSKSRQKNFEEKLDALASRVDVLQSAIRIILHDRIKYLARAYIAKNEVTFDDRRDLIDMHKIYHDGLGGNGNLDAIMKQFMEITVK